MAFVLHMRNTGGSLPPEGTQLQQITLWPNFGLLLHVPVLQRKANGDYNFTYPFIQAVLCWRNPAPHVN